MMNQSSSQSFHSGDSHKNSDYHEDIDKQNFDNSSVDDAADEESDHDLSVDDDASDHSIPGIKKLSEKTYTLKKWAFHHYNLQKKLYQKSKEVANALTLNKSLKAEKRNLKTKFVREKEKAISKSYEAKMANNARRASRSELLKAKNNFEKSLKERLKVQVALEIKAKDGEVQFQKDLLKEKEAQMKDLRSQIKEKQDCNVRLEKKLNALELQNQKLATKYWMQEKAMKTIYSSACVRRSVDQKNEYSNDAAGYEREDKLKKFFSRKRRNRRRKSKSKVRRMSRHSKSKRKRSRKNYSSSSDSSVSSLSSESSSDSTSSSDREEK